MSDRVTPEELAFDILENTHHNAFDPDDEKYSTSAVVVDEDGQGYGGVDVENVNFSVGFYAIANAKYNGVLNGATEFTEVVVATENPEYTPSGPEVQSVSDHVERGTPMRIFHEDGEVEDRVILYPDDSPTARTKDQITDFSADILEAEVSNEEFEPCQNYFEIDLDDFEHADGEIGEELEEYLADVARESMDRAYAIDSGFDVGSALLTEDGRVYQGANVENSDRKCTHHSEDVIANAYRHGEEPGNFVALATATDTEKPGSPCGSCRQTMTEAQDFAAGHEDLDVAISGQDDIVSMKLSELFPRPFSDGNM